MKSYINPAIANAMYNRMLALALAIGTPVLYLVVAALIVLRFTILALAIVVLMLICVVTGKEPDAALGWVNTKLDKWKPTSGA